MAKGAAGDGQMNTLVGNGTVIEGTLNISSSIRVDGKVKGRINCSDTLLVGKTGVVEASVKVKSATIGGRVEGDIQAQEVVILEGKSTVMGDVTTKKLIIEEGAVFNGTCRMGEEAERAGKGGPREGGGKESSPQGSSGGPSGQGTDREVPVGSESRDS
ncbi:MAG: polymer-forming cytoskeletal protein [bacterium]